MIQKAKALKQDLESKSYISSVTVSPAGNSQIKVLVDKSKIEQLRVSLSEIWNAIRINNRIELVLVTLKKREIQKSWFFKIRFWISYFIY